MTKQELTHRKPISCDKLTRVAKISPETLDYMRGYKKLYCYQDDGQTLYIPAKDYNDAKNQLYTLLRQSL